MNILLQGGFKKGGKFHEGDHNKKYTKSHWKDGKKGKKGFKKSSHGHFKKGHDIKVL